MPGRVSCAAIFKFRIGKTASGHLKRFWPSSPDCQAVSTAAYSATKPASKHAGVAELEREAATCCRAAAACSAACSQNRKGK